VIGALIIVFREILEAGLIVGIVLGATQRIPGSRNWIAGGIAAGVLGSMVVAAFTGVITNAFEGYGQELFNAGILSLAVLMLAWHTIWMARHGRSLASELRDASQQAMAGHRSFWALALIVGLAVLREGSEVVLFLYGIAVSGGTTVSGLLAGGAMGLMLGSLVAFLTFKGLVQIPSRYFFIVTNWLITLLAAGMAAQSVAFLEQAGAVTFMSQTLWDTSNWLSDASLPGRTLHTLVGYSDQPSLLQVTVYITVIALITLLARPSRSKANLSASAGTRPHTIT
jgi:high-affinity iron transporter